MNEARVESKRYACLTRPLNDREQSAGPPLLYHLANRARVQLMVAAAMRHIV
jgi:hypothetical protein